MKVMGMMTIVAFAVAVEASAGPVVREAAGANAAAIQAAVDQFRADIGGGNNGTIAGSQPFGRREISWDGGGAAATPTLDPSPMTRFSNRGTVFLTSGSGFEISGAPLAEFGEINATYPTLFTTFSTPRLFAPLNSNVMDVVFNVPGNTAIAAGSVGFGAVFTDVDSATSTWLQFYSTDGVLLFERAVPAASGDETLSFLGVTFNAGELVGRVRIVNGNMAYGPNETAGLDAVSMDDFIYAEPVAIDGLFVAPGSTTLVHTGQFDIVIAVAPAASAIVDGFIKFDGVNVTGLLLGCLRPGTLAGGGATFRCPLPGGLATAGDHTLQVQLQFADGSWRRNSSRWRVVGNTEP
jgi:hypothetical protein